MKRCTAAFHPDEIRWIEIGKAVEKVHRSCGGACTFAARRDPVERDRESSRQNTKSNMRRFA
ncbi:MAG: hypothetical protein H6566_26485 [Lewinellaceae bacterium]|nr:hypothetical protein [Lewinellaceae bacterium]